MSLLISWIIKPLIGAIVPEIISWIKKNQVQKDIETFRTEKEKLNGIRKELTEAKNLNDEKSSHIAAKLADVISKL